MKISVLYFAQLKMNRGLSSETINTQCDTAGDLYKDLMTRHDLKVPPTMVKAAVNDAFCDPEKQLADGDIVAFMPPMSGG